MNDYRCLLIALLLYSPFLAAQNLFNELQLKGEVRLIIEANTTVEGHVEEWGFEEREPMSIQILAFEQGRLVEERMLFMDREFFSKTYHYDAAGKLNAVDTEMSSTKTNTRVVYESDRIELSDAQQEIIYVLDDQGELKSRETRYLERGGNHILAYTEEGAEGKHFSNDTLNLTSKHVVDPDSKHLLEVLYYDLDGGLSNRASYRYKYDEQGNWIARLSCDQERGNCMLSERKIFYKDKSSDTEESLFGIWYNVKNDKALRIYEGGKLYEVSLSSGRVTDGGWSYNNDGKIRIDHGGLLNKRDYDYHLLPGLLMLRSDRDKEEIFVREPGNVTPKTEMAAIALEQEAKEDAFSTFREDGKQGLKRADGSIRIPAQYQDLRYLTDSRAIAKKDDLYFLLDLDKNTAISDSYGQLVWVSATVLRCKKESFFGLISIDGKLLTPPKYSRLLATRSDTYIVTDMHHNSFLIDENDKRLRDTPEVKYDDLYFGTLAEIYGGQGPSTALLTKEGDELIPHRLYYRIK